MRATIAGLAVAAALSAGCNTMRTVSLEDLGAIRPSEVRVTRTDQTTVVVAGPQAIGDTLMGYVNGEWQEIPATSLQQLVVKRRDKKKTAALVAAGLVGVATFAYMVSSSGDHVNPEALADCEDDPELPGCPLGPPLP
jgi:putative N-acetylmannosamine-6-phosphate epimerase